MNTLLSGMLAFIPKLSSDLTYLSNASQIPCKCDCSRSCENEFYFIKMLRRNYSIQLFGVPPKLSPFPKEGGRVGGEAHCERFFETILYGIPWFSQCPCIIPAYESFLGIDCDEVIYPSLSLLA